MVASMDLSDSLRTSDWPNRDSRSASYLWRTPCISDELCSSIRANF